MDDLILNIDGNDLKLLVDHLKNGGVGSSGNFRQVVENGVLTLYNNDVKIMEQADDGTWVRTGLYTGANSIHLGGTGTTGSKSHTLTVGGQNVIFINEWSAVGGNRIAFSPAWEGISCDGTTVLESSTRVYAPLSDYEPAGVPSDPNDASNTVPCVYETEAAENLVAFSLEVIAKEAYTGVIYATIESNFASSQGSELSGQYEEVITTDNGSLNLTFENPYWLNAGDKLKISLLKEDGEPLQVLKGMGGNQPWRMHNVRRFAFRALALREEVDRKADRGEGGLGVPAKLTSFDWDDYKPNRNELGLVLGNAGANKPPKGRYHYAQAFSWNFNQTVIAWPFNGAVGGPCFRSRVDGVWTTRWLEIYHSGMKEELVGRANHTGTQAISTIAGLQDILDEAARKTVSIGSFQQSSVKSDDWTVICELDDLTIECRNPVGATSQPIRIRNGRGEALQVMWDMRNNDNALFNGATGVGIGSSWAVNNLPENDNTASRRVWGSIYLSGNGVNKSENAWVFELRYHRFDNGYKIVAKLQSN